VIRLSHFTLVPADLRADDQSVPRDCLGATRKIAPQGGMTVNDRSFDTIVRDATAGVSRRRSLFMVGSAGVVAALANPFAFDDCASPSHLYCFQQS
jgi:hypothetical protein